jgi:predicted kinase
MEPNFVKQLYIVRGIPGSGKTTLANSLAYSVGAPVFSADQYFEKINPNGEVVDYKFDFTKLGMAHSQCQQKTEDSMRCETPQIYVANTFTTKKEMQPYFTLAKKYGYSVFSIVVENRHGNQNVHNVPADKVQIMKDRFDISL